MERISVTVPRTILYYVGTNLLSVYYYIILRSEYFDDLVDRPVTDRAPFNRFHRFLRAIVTATPVGDVRVQEDAVFGRAVAEHAQLRLRPVEFRTGRPLLRRARTKTARFRREARLVDGKGRQARLLADRRRRARRIA